MISANIVTSTPTLVVPPSQRSYRFVGLSNNGEKVAYLKFTPDSDAVTSTNGIALPPGAAILVDQDDSPILSSGIYAVCGGSDTTTVAVQAY